MKPLGLVLVLVSLVIGCGDDPPDAQYVRLRNATEFDFTRVNIAGLEFGPLPSGATSAYKENHDALLYRVVGGDAETAMYRFFGMVTDHVGDVPLENGYFTFLVGADLDRNYFDGYSGPVSFNLQ